MPPVDTPRRIVVTVASAPDTLDVLRDSGALSAVADFINARRGGWEEPWGAVPWGPLSLRLEYEDGSRRYFVVNRTAFIRQDGASLFRRADSAEVAALLALVGAEWRHLDPRTP